jgi:hypothetical protein
VLLRAAPYVWTEQYQSAVLELDSQDPLVQIAKAERLIKNRETELLQGATSDSTELGDIARALRVLTLLREIGQKGTPFGTH